MKLFFIFFLLVQALLIRAADTVHVVTHNRQTVVTNPANGFNLYTTWGRFPSSGEPVRQIKLHVKFGCPDSMRCADWDYKDHITIRRTGGVHGPSQDYEIGRMLTPYGGAFGKDWQFGWEVDVTDFSLLLRDSVEIEYNHTGYEPNEDRGWSITLDFEIIKGRPAIEPISIQKIYDGAFRYGDSSNSIENSLKAVSFTAHNGAQFARLRLVQTGHGMDKPDGCGEFCNKYREIWFDGELMARKNIWKECGNNPLYPQAGTWIYDRADWCPGYLMQPDIYDLHVKPGQQHTLDVNMQPYLAFTPGAEEVISAYLIQYKKPQALNDVRIDDVISPSSKDIYRRFNPSAMQPKIIVRNMGHATASTMNILYGTKAFAKKRYNWKGAVAAGAIDTLALPGIIDGKTGRNDFEVEITRVNGKKDAYTADNKMAGPFKTVPRHDSVLVVYLLTNNQPAQNGYMLENSHGTILRKRDWGSLAANTVYRDTVVLQKGHYRFTITDSADNGLEFWANARGGRGKLRLLNGKGEMIKDFESDFGSFVQYDFEVADVIDAVSSQSSFGLYPTRTNDKTTFDFFANTPQDVVVQIVTDPGDKIVEEHRYQQLKEALFTYDLSRFPKGRFYFKVFINGKEKFKKRIRLKE